MKKYFLEILILGTVLLSQQAYAQSCLQEASYKGGGVALEKFLNKKFAEEFRKSKVDVCLISTTFAKFTIDSVGNIKNIIIFEDRDTPPVFRKMLTSVIQKTNGNWVPKKINSKPVESRPFILPLIYEMEAGCKAPANNDTTNSLLSFLDFKDGNGEKISQLDCILLKPLHMFSAN